MGQALPESDARRGCGDRDSPGVRGGGLRRGVHARAARAGRTPARGDRGVGEGRRSANSEPVGHFGTARTPQRGKITRAMTGRSASPRAHRRDLPRPSRGASSRRWSACSATSTSPRKRCTTLSRRGRAVAARGRAGQPARVARLDGPLQGDRRACAAARFDAARRRRRRGSTAVADETRPARRRRRSRTTACASSSPAATRRSRPDAQVALTLREVCGLTTEEIAARSSPPRRRWRSASCAPRRRSATPRIPYEVPAPDELPAAARRACCASIYLVFNEGYSPRRASRSRGSTSRARRSAWAGCSSSCCPSRRRWACSR